MQRKALIVFGGWDGHEPDKIATLFQKVLEDEGFSVSAEGSLDPLIHAPVMEGLSLIVPIWTMGTITTEQCQGALQAVAEHGVGLAGCHGGMCDAFRENTDWQFMTGGQWVAHPGNDGVRYRVHICDPEHEITTGLDDFDVVSEQYYLHTDPGNHVLATTRFPHPEHAGVHAQNPCQMPQVWVKSFGRGRVFYNALGHKRAVLESGTARELMRRGFIWAAKDVG